MFKLFSQCKNVQFLKYSKSFYSSIVLTDNQKKFVDNLYDGILNNKRADLAKSITLGK